MGRLQIVDCRWQILGNYSFSSINLQFPICNLQFSLGLSKNNFQHELFGYGRELYQGHISPVAGRRYGIYQ
jgi:hypothetical protein